MTPVELRTLILALADNHAAKVAYLAGNDEACAVELRKPALTGNIPPRHVDAILARFFIVGGLLSWVSARGTLPVEFGGGDAPFGLYSLASSLVRIAENANGVVLYMGDLEAADQQIQQLIEDQLISQEFIDALKAGEVKTALVEGAHHLQVAEARNA